MARKDDPYELASRRILGALLEAEAIELASERGLIPLSRALASLLLDIEAAEARGRLVADWLVEHVEVADLWADDAQLEALLAEHWDTDADQPERVGVRRPDPELEATLLAAIDDDDPAWLVYSDWLQSQGDLLGELGALQAAARAAEPAARKRAQGRVTTFIRRHREALLGVAGEHPRIVRLDWGVGTLRGARISTSRYGDKQFHGAALLGALLDQPVARYLRELWLGPIDQRDGDQYAEMVAVLLSRERPTLRALAIGTVDLDGSTHGIHNNRTYLGDLARLDERLPRLELLRLRGNTVELAPLRSPTLARLHIELHAPSADAYQAIADSSLPNLRTLTWAVRGGRPMIDAFKHMVDPARAPALERLELEVGNNYLFTNAFHERPAPPKLRELALANWTVREPTLIWLMQRLRLRRIEIRNCRVELSDSGRRIVEELGAELVIEDPIN